MSGTYRDRPSGSSSRGGFGGAESIIWAAMDELRGRFEQRPAPPAGHGDIRAAVLAVLLDRPMHGSEIISAIEERSRGGWKPSPGSVYPTLQLLADEGLVTAEESAGRKIYSLTDAGRAAARAGNDGPAPWDVPEASATARAGALPKAGMQLAQATAQVAQNGSPAQIAEAVEVLDEARRKLYSILARS